MWRTFILKFVIFIGSFLIKDLLSTYSVSGTFVDPEDTVNQNQKFSTLWSIQWERQAMNKKSMWHLRSGKFSNEKRAKWQGRV